MSEPTDRERRRLEILEALELLETQRSVVLNVIAKAADGDAAEAALIKRFDLTLGQARAIADLRLRRLAVGELQAVREEREFLGAFLAERRRLPGRPVDRIELPLTDARRSDFSRAALTRDGFVGWLTFDQLRAEKLAQVSSEGGVYVILRKSGGPPKFLKQNPGGWFKGEDPSLTRAKLKANWVDGAKVVYIGKANALRRRLDDFARFGAGAPIGHWGGRLIWQLADPADLLVAWKPTPDEDPRAVESRLIADFRSAYGKPPFANEPQKLGR